MTATRGMTMGARMALAPARVPSTETRMTEQTIVASMARFVELIPIFFIMVSTMCSATPVFLRTAPSAAPIMMMNPIIVRKEPRDSAITEPRFNSEWLVMIALRITEMRTFNIGLISLNARTT
jgi:hypothetical protein